MPEEAVKAQIEWTRQGTVLVCALSGTWKLGANEGVHLSDNPMSKGEAPTELRFTSKDLGDWDSSVLAVIIAIHGECDKKGVKVDITGLCKPLQQLIELATAVPAKEDARRISVPKNIAERTGLKFLSIWENTLETVDFLGECSLILWKLLRHTSQLRVKDFLAIMQEVGLQALPIVSLISFLIGLIIAFLGAVVLVKFGADYYVSYLVGYGMLREMGAVMCGIIMAGRTGAAFAAQIGSMKVSEEIDALRTSGFSPVEFLVVPRIIALSLMMPLLTVYADVVGIIGGMLVSSQMLGIPTEQFYNGLIYAVDGSDFILGVVKGSVFGIIIAVSGCLRGMQCGNSADAVGMAATSAVVTGITYIILANAVIDWVAALYGF
ncbi:MAG: ABC transporter permease [Verrucomicrobiota bacterium]|nr:ABC transporter permease [Verrucomicrobiota bacterium]